MVEHIEEILKTGDYSLRAKAAEEISCDVARHPQPAVARAKKVAFLWTNFKAATVAESKSWRKKASCATCPDSARRANKTFSKRSRRTKRSSGRFRLDTAENAAAQIVEHISAYPKGRRRHYPSRIAAA